MKSARASSGLPFEIIHNGDEEIGLRVRVSGDALLRSPEVARDLSAEDGDDT